MSGGGYGRTPLKVSWLSVSSKERPLTGRRCVDYFPQLEFHRILVQCTHEACIQGRSFKNKITPQNTHNHTWNTQESYPEIYTITPEIQKNHTWNAHNHTCNIHNHTWNIQESHLKYTRITPWNTNLELAGTNEGLSLHIACELFSGHEAALGSEQDPTPCSDQCLCRS